MSDEQESRADALKLSEKVTRWHVLRINRYPPRCCMWYAIRYSEAYRQFWRLPQRLTPDTDFKESRP